MWYRTLGIVCALLVSTTAANAQMSGGLTNPLSFGLAAGSAIPNSDLSDVTKTGYNITGMLGFKPPIIPVGLRVDASYNSFGYKPTASDNGRAHIASVTGNVVLSTSFLFVHPYLIGGIGYYDVKAPAVESSDNFGFDLGGGVSVSIPLTRVSVFAEARYNHVSTTGAGTAFTPIVLGVMF